MVHLRKRAGPLRTFLPQEFCERKAFPPFHPPMQGLSGRSLSLHQFFCMPPPIPLQNNRSFPRKRRSTALKETQRKSECTQRQASRFQRLLSLPTHLAYKCSLSVLRGGETKRPLEQFASLSKRHRPLIEIVVPHTSHMQRQRNRTRAADAVF